MKNVVSIGLYLFYASLHFHKIEIYPTTAELKEGSNHGFLSPSFTSSVSVSIRRRYHLLVLILREREHLLSVLESCFNSTGERAPIVGVGELF